MTPPPPRSTLFPYTTLFRSVPTVLHTGETARTNLRPLQQWRMGADLPRNERRLSEGGSISAWSGQRADGKDRKSTRLNSSHGYISYAVLCLKKKKHKHTFRD